MSWAAITGLLSSAGALVKSYFSALFEDRREARKQSAQEEAGKKTTKVAQDVLKMDPDDAAARIRKRVRKS